MKLTQYQVDAFARRVFEGNPAAVCPLPHWLDDTILQAIATENNLSETAFFVPDGAQFQLRWFTPTSEVDLCGHATLASAHVLFEILGHPEAVIRFTTRSGLLTVRRGEWGLEMDFPSSVPSRCACPEWLAEGLGHPPLETWVADDYIALYDSEAIVGALRPDPTLLGRLDRRGVIATAPGVSHDFVSRFFAPKLGVPEDPVTGSAHCALAPFWADRLGKSRLMARQVSYRGGEMLCEVQGHRVLLTGQAATFMTAEIAF